MLTPEQLEEVSFGTVRFNGYNMKDVDALMDTLTEDYVTLYKENTLLKSKMRVIVAKLEEYHAAEASMKEAVVNAQKTCDAMVAEAKAKCEAMLKDAGADAQKACAEADTLVAAENARVESARQVATRQIGDLQTRLEGCIRLLEEIKEANRPTKLPPVPEVSENTAAVADQIAASLEAIAGEEEDVLSSQLPPLDTEAMESKFANLLFGKNYNPEN